MKLSKTTGRIIFDPKRVLKMIKNGHLPKNQKVGSSKFNDGPFWPKILSWKIGPLKGSIQPKF